MAATVEEAFGWIGTSISVCLFGAPGLSMMCCGGAARFTPYPYAVTAANCAVWIMYGTRQIDGTRVIIVNTVGVTLEAIYVILFFSFSAADDRRRDRLIRFVVVGVVVVVVGAVCLLINETLTNIFCALCGCAVYAVPLYDVYKVLMSRRARYMPNFFVASPSLLNCIAWCIYTGIRHENYMLTPNMVGAVCATVQLVLHLAFYIKMNRLAFAQAQAGDDEHLVLAEDDDDFSLNPKQLFTNLRLLFSDDEFFV